MSELKRIERLIKESKASLKKYETVLAADAADFGAKLMVGNIKWHIHDLENQASELRAIRTQSTHIGKGTMAASGSL
ncbi:MAG TPA: hypothetical protein VHS96_03380 [Bacteroidia bacterium]|nr:hypothetical protein [Bacteroidia bacterium]